MKLIKLVFSLLLILLIVLAFVLPSRVIGIAQVDCETQFGKCDTYLQGKIDEVKGKKLGEVKKRINEVLKGEVFVQDSGLQFNLPNKLKVYVLLRKPMFALKSLERNVYGLIDKEGKVISIVAESNLPTVEVKGNIPNVGERVDEKSLFALETLNDIFYLYQEKLGSLEEDKLVIDLTAGPKVLFPLTGDRQVLLGSLRLILSRLMTGQEDLRIDNIGEIDLRFKNPVLR